MKGFAEQFKDLPDYILKITYQIWEEKDPVIFCEKELLGLSDFDVDKHHNETQIIVNNAFEYAKKSPFPNPEEAYTDLFAN